MAEDLRTVDEQREEIGRSIVDEGDTETPDPLNGLASIPGMGMTQPKGKWAWENQLIKIYACRGICRRDY